MRELLTKSAPAEFKVDTSSSDWIVEGYASTFGNMDSYGDIIQKGAFKKTIRERGRKGEVKVLWEHFEPMGLPVEKDGLAEDDYGLYTRSRISKTDTNRERLQLMKDGVVDKMSIGFTIPEGKSKWNADYTERQIKEVILYEYSMVMFPANELAAVASVQKHAQLAHMLERLDKDKVFAYAKTFEGVDMGRLENALDALFEITEGVGVKGAHQSVIAPTVDTSTYTITTNSTNALWNGPPPTNEPSLDTRSEENDLPNPEPHESEEEDEKLLIAQSYLEELKAAFALEELNREMRKV